MIHNTFFLTAFSLKSSTKYWKCFPPISTIEICSSSYGQPHISINNGISNFSAIPSTKITLSANNISDLVTSRNFVRCSLASFLRLSPSLSINCSCRLCWQQSSDSPSRLYESINILSIPATAEILLEWVVTKICWFRSSAWSKSLKYLNNLYCIAGWRCASGSSKQRILKSRPFCISVSLTSI